MEITLSIRSFPDDHFSEFGKTRNLIVSLHNKTYSVYQGSVGMTTIFKHKPLPDDIRNFLQTTLVNPGPINLIKRENDQQGYQLFFFELSPEQQTFAAVCHALHGLKTWGAHEVDMPWVMDNEDYFKKLNKQSYQVYKEDWLQTSFDYLAKLPICYGDMTLNISQ